ncbi:Kinase-like protein [Mycena sanguinolenta]|uniref:mitogen-activated protein kinase kinase kinase n=1 Tax=Mycena sanguinolenta TaxID=230812 RepID=A0A8H6Z985_9AGAR|nr:Kinase-like protein [Mycena sanguinolenta]
MNEDTVTGSRILLYEASLSFLKDACSTRFPARIPSEAEVLRRTVDDYISSMTSNSVVNAIVESLECRKRVLQVSTELALTNDPNLRTAMRADEERIAAFLVSIFSSKSDEETVLRLEGDSAQHFLDVVQETLDRGFIVTQEHTKMALKIIRRLSALCDKLPSSLFIVGVEERDEHPSFGGGFGDIYRASYGGQRVALKRMRHFLRGSDLRRIRLKFCREALVWKDLHHPNILPFLGIDRDSFPSSLCMVSPWMEHGTVINYLKTHGFANVDKLLYEIAQGLEYLHSHNIVHGDLRGANILIKEDWSACLTDFGLSIFSDATSTMSTNRGGSLYWMAPELLLPERFGLKFARTPATDVYAFGCVCFELYTQRPPLSGLPEPAACMKVLDGGRAERPLGLPVMSDTLWQNITEFWAQGPATRPSVQFVVQQMVWPYPDLPSDMHPALSTATTDALLSSIPSTPETTTIQLDEPSVPFLDLTDFGVEGEVLPVWPDAESEQVPLVNSILEETMNLVEELPMLFRDLTDLGIDAEALPVDANQEQVPPVNSEDTLVNSDDTLFDDLPEDSSRVKPWSSNEMFAFPDYQRHPLSTISGSVIGNNHSQSSLVNQDEDGEDEDEDEDESIHFVHRTRLWRDDASSLYSNRSRSPSPVRLPMATHTLPSALSLSSVSTTSQDSNKTPLSRKGKWWQLGALRDFLPSKTPSRLPGFVKVQTEVSIEYDGNEISSTHDIAVERRPAEDTDGWVNSGVSCRYKARALYSYRSSATNSDDISFSCGEILDIVEKHAGWCRAKKTDESGSTGMAPCDYLQIIPPEDGGDQGNYRYRAVARWAYRASPNDPNEISFNKSDILVIVDWWDGWCLAKKADGSLGLAPSNCLLGIMELGEGRGPFQDLRISNIR